MTSVPVLIQPDPRKPYTVETDSSDFGNGMTLLQESDDGKLHPVAFDGRKLHGHELKYPTHEKELQAIKDALTKWRHYVNNGLPITIITDHDSLKYMNTIKNPSKRIARWMDEFQQYNLVIRYRPGKEAIVPDALSRRPDYLNLMLDELSKDEYISCIRKFFEDKQLSDNITVSDKKKLVDNVDKFELF